MTDEELVRGFEAASLPPGAFGHAEHVRVAWWYLRRHPWSDALARIRGGLQRFAAAAGRPERYHETITVMYARLIAERLAVDDGGDWNAFAARNPDLFERGLLERYYRWETLVSEDARVGWVAPDGVAAVRTGGVPGFRNHHASNSRAERWLFLQCIGAIMLVPW